MYRNVAFSPTVPPRWADGMLPPAMKDLLLNDVSDITCDATGFPFPEVAWLHLGKSLGIECFNFLIDATGGWYSTFLHNQVPRVAGVTNFLRTLTSSSPEDCEYRPRSA